MSEQFLFDYFGIPVALWVILYISDYYLTIWGAHLYATGGKNHLILEGSYELNPIFEQDINLLRWISSRFLLLLMLYTVALLILRGLFRDLSFLFLLATGGLILLEVFVHLRHVRNIVFLWHLRRNEGVAGQLEYKRWFTLRSSSIEALFFAVFFGAVALLGGSWFFAGGALACLGIFIRHGFRARQALRALPVQTQQKG